MPELRFVDIIDSLFQAAGGGHHCLLDPFVVEILQGLIVWNGVDVASRDSGALLSQFSILELFLDPVVAVVLLVILLHAVQPVNHAIDKDILRWLVGHLPVDHLRDGLLLQLLYSFVLEAPAE